ncbi:hypothetical protein LTR10_018095 [Elasticomyces elasticus]|uniref:DASH complex subunit DUO1 n=1 Tax=Exophiala sideris TaxID=1016849 RepID=A0ABR0IW62_9EURO|nr:hypothetical protein LTR10_018095 [Elasticomyces elasticus]KAK5021692.1 hypothetical protein LTS07_010734 [Exophiala sideris]KAK5025153.1 hypothetical protein LTR13_010590 [Exophiala sideris]KAK5050123.1 hypothetical protein LTR69_010757 [Exophiala sideris]KAK5176871.1 hypothetical protein LTR44_010567 [Eurotiomycetes sp. CCFEE 6388]
MDPDDSLMADHDAEENLWDSPVKPRNDSGETPRAFTKHADAAKPTYQEQQEREQSLRRELESVRQVNQAIEGVIQSLNKARDNMKTVNGTVVAASTLLNTWTRILSQTEHNQRLILDPSWHGASQDIADIEEEALEKQRAAERREAEEQERKMAAARMAEEEEKRKADLAAKQSRPTSARGGRIGAGGRVPSASSSYVKVGGSGSSSSGSKRGTSSTGRGTSGIGRGISGRGSRGRG